MKARPRDEWSESDGSVLWWKFPLVEPPYVGDLREDDFPDYHTHWTPLEVPDDPSVSLAIERAEKARAEAEGA